MTTCIFNEFDVGKIHSKYFGIPIKNVNGHYFVICIFNFSSIHLYLLLFNSSFNFVYGVEVPHGLPTLTLSQNKFNILGLYPDIIETPGCIDNAGNPSLDSKFQNII